MKHRTIRRLMTTDVASVRRTATFKEIVATLAQRGISAVPVVDDDDVVLGVVSEDDLLCKESGARRRIVPWRTRRATGNRKAKATRAGDLMTAPAITTHADEDIGAAARTLQEHGIKRLPVVDVDGKLIGIVSRRDLLGVFLRSDHDISEEIAREILERALCAAPHTVSADVTDGVVVLRGQLERRSMLPIAEALIRRVDGVVAVISHLTYAMDDTNPPRSEPTNTGILHGLTQR